MFGKIFLILLIIWIVGLIGGFTLGGLINILLALAIVSLIMHLWKDLKIFLHGKRQH